MPSPPTKTFSTPAKNPSPFTTTSATLTSNPVQSAKPSSSATTSWCVAVHLKNPPPPSPSTTAQNFASSTKTTIGSRSPAIPPASAGSAAIRFSFPLKLNSSFVLVSFVNFCSSSSRNTHHATSLSPLI